MMTPADISMALADDALRDGYVPARFYHVLATMHEMHPRADMSMARRAVEQLENMALWHAALAIEHG